MSESKMPTNAYSRRSFLKLAGTSVAAVALAACAAPAAPGAVPAEGGAAPAAEATKITVMSFGETPLPAFKAMADAYMAANPGKSVETVFLLDDETYYAGLQTAYAGGSNPDIASMQGWGFQIFADNGVIHGLNELRQRDSYDYAWGAGPSVRDSTERNGDTYLTPLQIATMVMFYLKKPFDDAGLPYPTDDWTFDQFVETATALTKTDGDAKMWGYQTSLGWFRDIHWIRGTGKQEFDTLIDPHTSQFNQPEIVEIVQLIASDFMYKMGISPRPVDMQDGAGVIESGMAAMKYEGPWFFPRLNTQKLRDEGKEREFDVVLMPQQGEKRTHRGWAEGLVMFNTAPVDAAWDVVKFMSGEEGQKIHSDLTGRIPNNPALVESYWAPTIEANHGVKNYKAFLTAFENGVSDVISGLPRNTYWLEVVKPVGWDPLMGGQATAADVLPLVDEGVQKILDDYWAGKG